MNYLYPLIAVHISGETILLYSDDAVLAFIKKHGRFTEHHVEWYYDWPTFTRRMKANGWIVRDDRGRVVKYDDVCWKYTPYSTYNQNMAKTRAIAAKGLPIPRTGKRKWHCHHAPAKKNSGAGHRNRNRALAIYDAEEYGVKNNIGGRVIPHEGWL